MKNNTFTEIIMILDRSGSMAPLAASTVAGFNSFLEEQKTLPGEARFTCILFNNRAMTLYDRVPLNEVPPMTPEMFKPCGMTALNDAVGGAIDHIVSIQCGQPEASRASKVVFAITTDGFENSSRIYTRSRLRDMIRYEQERYGWEFLFLGANIDSGETAESYGISRDHAVDYIADEEGTAENFRAVGKAMRMVRACASISSDWKAEAEADHKKRSK